MCSFFAQLEPSTNKIKLSLKSGSKVGYSFYKVSHITLISNPNAIKSEIHITFDEFVLCLVKSVSKYDITITPKVDLVKTPTPKCDFGLP